MYIIIYSLYLYIYIYVLPRSSPTCSLVGFSTKGTGIGSPNTANRGTRYGTGRPHLPQKNTIETRKKRDIVLNIPSLSYHTDRHCKLLK